METNYRQKWSASLLTRFNIASQPGTNPFITMGTAIMSIPGCSGPVRRAATHQPDLNQSKLAFRGTYGSQGAFAPDNAENASDAQSEGWRVGTEGLTIQGSVSRLSYPVNVNGVALRSGLGECSLIFRPWRSGNRTTNAKATRSRIAKSPAATQRVSRSNSLSTALAMGRRSEE